MLQLRTSQISLIKIASIRRGFAHVSWSGLILSSSCHTLNIWKASFLRGSSHFSSSCLLVRMSSYTWRIGIAFLLWGSSHESLKSGLILRSSCHTSSIWKASLVWVLSSHAPSRNLILKKLCHTLFCAIKWLPSWVDPIMGFQVTWYWEALVKISALEWLPYRVGPFMFLKLPACKNLFIHFNYLLE